MNIPIKIRDIHPGMILIVEDEATVVVSEVWEDQGPGLGIMLKGTVVADASSWESRYLNVDAEVERIVSGNPNTESPTNEEYPFPAETEVDDDESPA